MSVQSWRSGLIDNTRKTIFSPQGDTIDAFLNFIGTAQKKILIADYSLVWPALVDLLLQKFKAGVDVRMVLDKTQEAGRSESPEVEQLKQAGVPLAIGTSSMHHIMHLKIAIVDDEWVESGCYSQDTEVLSENGWKRFPDLLSGERIMTLNPVSGGIEYYAPTDYISYPYKGEMIHWNGLAYDLLVTPNHRVYCMTHRGDRKEVWKLRSAREVRNKRLWFKKDGRWDCEDMDYFTLPSVVGDRGKPVKDIPPIPINDWLSFLGWWLAEGSVLHHKDGHHRVYIEQFKYQGEILALLHRLPFKFYFNQKYGQFTLWSKQLRSYLLQFGGAGNKFIPSRIKALPPHRLHILLEAMFRGDGHFERGRWKRYTSKSKRLADDVLECLIKCGLSGAVTTTKGRPYAVSVNHNWLTPEATRKSKSVNYDGIVYDVTVPNHILMVRRNGKPLWSGNSYNYTLTAAKECNVIDIEHSPDRAAVFTAAWQSAWAFIKANEPQGVFNG